MEAIEASISGTARRRRPNLTGTSEAAVSLGGVALLVVDPQMDFHEGGSLAVPGASADAARIARLVVDHSDDIDEVIVTLDSHHVSATTPVVLCFPLAKRVPYDYYQVPGIRHELNRCMRNPNPINQMYRVSSPLYFTSIKLLYMYTCMLPAACSF